MQRFIRATIIFILLIVGIRLLFLGGTWLLLRYSSLNTTPDNRLPVVATFYPLAEFAHQVGQDKVTVRNLTPAGSEPHDYEPTPQDVAAIENAKVFIYNGAGLEVWLNKLGDLNSAHSVVVNSSQGLELIPNDPHLWMDPVSAAVQVENIARGLIAADPANRDYYQKNAAQYEAQLSALDSSFKAGLSDCKTKDIVTSHNAFQYLGRRYGLTVEPISGLSPDEEPSPQKMSEVVAFIRQNNVHYVFFESLVSPKLSETIASETGAQTLVFNPLEGLTEEELASGKNYISVQQDNLQVLKTALQCQ